MDVPNDPLVRKVRERLSATYFQGHLSLLAPDATSRSAGEGAFYGEEAYYAVGIVSCLSRRALFIRNLRWRIWRHKNVN